MSEESLDARLTKEVTSLSTKLVTAVAKQSELEESVLHLHKENSTLKASVTRLQPIEKEYNTLLPKYTRLLKETQQIKQSKEATESENRRLKSEVEDLSESLFNEANQMVSDASRETYNFKVKNRKLYEEIDEKNTIIDSLQDQLKDLKSLFIKIEDQQKLIQSSSRANTPKLDSSQFTHHNDDLFPGSANDDATTTTASDSAYDGSSLTNNYGDLNNSISQSGENSLHAQQLQSILYSPTVKAIRFDLANYQQDFKGFIFQMIKPDFTFDLVNLQKLKFFRKIWQEELENSIANVPSIPSSSFINRWQKGKNFWNLIVEGKAMIQPVSGINETFKLTYKGQNRNYNEVPVAVKDPCAFCGESKDDVLEHARLYTLKLMSPVPIGTSPTSGTNSAASTTATSANSNSATPNVSTTTLNGEKHEVIANYPLCNFCLIKLRSICDFFAKLRLIHSNVYRLKQTHQYDDSAFHASSNFQFKRNSSGNYGINDWEKFGPKRTTTSPSLGSPSGAASSTTADQGSPKVPNLDDVGGAVPKEARGIPLHSSNTKVDISEECILMKLYILLILIRNKIYWSKVGFWDNTDDIAEVNIDELHYEAFKIILEEEITLRRGSTTTISPVQHHRSRLPESPSQVRHENDVSESSPGDLHIAVTESPSNTNTEPSTTSEGDLATDSRVVDSSETNLTAAEANTTTDTSKINSTTTGTNTTTDSKASSNTTSPKSTIPTTGSAKTHAPQAAGDAQDDSEDEFADTTDKLSGTDTKETPSEDVVLEGDSPSKNGLSRRNSKSQQFSTKLNSDLDETLEMLRESIEQ